MAVYTHLASEQIQAIVAAYRDVPVVSFTPIAEGVDNTNYLLELASEDEPKAILTVFESRLAVEELPFFIDLMDYLAQQGIPCPTPWRQKENGKGLFPLQGGKKCAAIVSFLEGKQLLGKPSASHLKQLGEMMEKMHLAAKGFPEKRSNDLSLAGWRRLYERTAEEADSVSPGLKQMIEDELHFLMEAWPITLPSGVVHADLFPDNVFFDHDQLSGVIDFYFSCNDLQLYDVAITLNAWCVGIDGKPDVALCKAFWEGYQAVRPLQDNEPQHLPTLMRGAALRFLLTRLYDWLNPQEGALVTAKDPKEYVRKLAFHQQATIQDYGL